MAIGTKKTYCWYRLFVVLLVMMAIRITEGYRHCPAGWQENDFSCVTINSELLTWYDAEKACESMAPGAILYDLGFNMEMNTTPGMKWINHVYDKYPTISYWTFHDNISTSGWNRLPNNLPSQYCGYYNTTGSNSYGYTNCYQLLPSICSYRLYPVQSLQDRMGPAFPFNRLYGARDIAMESTRATVKYLAMLKTGVVKNVVTTAGPSGKPNTAMRFVGGLNSFILINDTSYNWVLNPRGPNWTTTNREDMTEYVFSFLATNSSGTIFSTLSKIYPDGKGNSVAYNATDNTLIVQFRYYTCCNSKTVTVTGCVIPGVWNRIVMHFDPNTHLYVNNPKIQIEWCASGRYIGWYPADIVDSNGLIFGKDPATGLTWSDGAINAFNFYTALWQYNYWSVWFHQYDEYNNATTQETYMDDDIIRRLPQAKDLPFEYNHVGFWPMTDYYRGKEGSGKIYQYVNYTASYTLNPWLMRYVFNGTGADKLFRVAGPRDFASVALYQKSFTFVMHVYRNKLSKNEFDTVGPLLEYPNGDTTMLSGLTIWMLPNETLMVVASPSVANGNATFSASFLNCYPTGLPMGAMGSTYRLSIVYNYDDGTMAAYANDALCDGGVKTVGQFNFDTMNGFVVGYSNLSSPFLLSVASPGGSTTPRAFLGGQLFCLSIYDTADLTADHMTLLTDLCNITSALTPVLSGPNNLIYKAANLRVFWPLGRDLCGVDLSGRGHNADCYRMASTTGPTGLPYSASHFHGYSGGSLYWGTPFLVHSGKPEHAYTMGSNNSVTYAMWFFAATWYNGDIDGNLALFAHGEMGNTDLYPFSTTAYILDTNPASTIRFLIKSRAIDAMWVDLVVPKLMNRWIWAIFQYNREENYIYMNVDGVEKTVSVAAVFVTTNTWLAVGASHRWRFRGGRMSCFMMYDYAVARWEIPALQRMCNSTLQYYYGKYDGLFSYPSTLALFWPLTQRYLANDISGRNLHGSLSFNGESVSSVTWAEGPTGRPATAARLAGPRCSSQVAIQRRTSYNDLTNQLYNLWGSANCAGIASGQTSNGQTISFYFVFINDTYNHRILHLNDNDFAILYTGIDMRICISSSGSVRIIDQWLKIPAKYSSGQWIFFSLVMETNVTSSPYKLTSRVYFDGELQWTYVYSTTTYAHAFAALYHGFTLGRDPITSYCEGEHFLSCLSFINEPADPRLIKADCDRILSGKYDALIASNVKPAVLFPLSAQTEGDNVVGSPHGYYMDVDFTEPNQAGLPRTSMTLKGSNNQYFIADQTYNNGPTGLLNVKDRALATTVLYNAKIDPNSITSSVYGTVFGFNNQYGITGGYINTTNGPQAFFNYYTNRGQGNTGAFDSMLFNPYGWRTIGWHSDGIGDNVFVTVNGSMSSVYQDQSSTYYYWTTSSLTIGMNPTVPLSLDPRKYPFIGSLSCFQIYESGLNPLERDQAMKWCANPDYVGCYPFSTVSTVAAISDRLGMSATKCRNFCAQMGQRFANVMRSSTCHCANSLPATQPVPGMCPRTVAANALEEGGGSSGYASVYTSALTRRISQLSFLKILTLSCQPGWRQIPSLYLNCFRIASPSTLDYYNDLTPKCKNSMYGFQSALWYPEDETEDQALELFRYNENANSPPWLWLGCYGNLVNNPPCKREDGKPLLTYYMAPRDGTYAVSKEPNNVTSSRTITAYRLKGVCKTLATQLDVCPRGTQRVFNYCYDFVNTPSRFQEAESYCQQTYTGGHLVTLYNFAQLRLILNITDHMSPFWIGATFSAPGNWSWIGYEKTSPWTYWALGFSPYSSLEITSPCVYADSRSTYQWRTASCERRFPFVCQIPADYQSRAMKTQFGSAHNYGITSSAPNSRPYAAHYYIDSPQPEQPCWCGRSAMNGSEYVQIDYAGPLLVKAVRVQGCLNGASSSYVSHYMVNYSTDGLLWNTYTWTNTSYLTNSIGQISSGGTPTSIVLPPIAGPTAGESVLHYIQTPFVARYVRIIPVQFNVSMCLHFNIFSDLVDPTLPDIRANSFYPIYVDMFRDAGMGVTYKLHVYRLGFSPMPQLYSVSSVIKTNDFVYAPRLIGAQKLILVATDAEGRETEASINLQLETRTRDMYFSSCPTVSPAAQMVKCFVRIVGGSNFTMTTTYGTPVHRGYRQYQTRVVATRHEYGLITSTGAAVYFSNTALQNRLYLLANFPFEKPTTVHAIEVNLRVPGRIFVQFLQPYCTGATTFCMQSYTCLSNTVACKNQQAYDGYSCPAGYKKCDARAGCCSTTIQPYWLPPNRNYFNGTTSPVTFQFIKEVELWFPGRGFQIHHFQPDDIQEFPIGTIMGLRFGVPAYGFGEVHLLQSGVSTFSTACASPPCATSIGTGSTTSHDFVPMLRAITVDSTTFGMHIYWSGTCGTVPFSATAVDANWPEKSFSITQNIAISAPCPKPEIVRPNILYAQTPYVLQLRRTFDCFCNYEITWSDVAGTQLLNWAADTLSMTFSRTFRDAGIYQVLLRVWNDRNDTTYKYTLNVFVPMETMRLQIANPPALPLGQDNTVDLMGFAAAPSNDTTIVKTNLTVTFNDSTAGLVVKPDGEILNGGQCLPGWTKQLSGACLIFVNQTLNFGDAEYYCASLGATLAYASTSGALIWSNISGLAAPYNASGMFWTGITRKRSRSNFWVTLSNEGGPISNVELLTGSAAESDCAAYNMATTSLVAQPCTSQLRFPCQQPSTNYKLCSYDGEQWTPYGGRCFQAFPTWADTFQQAVRDCKKLGATLAVPRTAAEIGPMVDILKPIVNSNAAFYIGAWQGDTSSMMVDGFGNIHRVTTTGSNNCFTLSFDTKQLESIDCTTTMPAICERPFASEAKPRRYFNRLANRRLIREGDKFQPCPDGWTRIGDFCYSVNAAVKSLSNAFAACKLAVVHNAAENDALTALLSNAAVTSAWIGLATGGASNGWLWLDGSGSPSAVGYSNWPQSTPLAAPAVSGTYIASANGSWMIADSTNTLPFVCMRKPSDFGYGRTFAGNCHDSTMVEVNGTCYSRGSLSNLRTFQEAAGDCLATYGGTLVAPSSPEEWTTAMLFLFSSLQWNGPQVAAWAGLAISGGAVVMPSALSGSSPADLTPFIKWVPNYSPDLSQPGCLAIHSEGGLKVVSCSTSLAYWCQAPAAICPVGWTIWGGSCYKASEVDTNTNAIPATDITSSFCDLLGAYPLSIASSLEQSVVRKLVPQTSPVVIGQSVVAGGTLKDAAGRTIYNPSPPSNSQTARAYVDMTDTWASVIDSSDIYAQTVCHRPSLLTPDDCAVACMTSTDPVCITFEYHGDYCLLLSDSVTKYSYGLRSALGGSDIYSVDSAKTHCWQSLLVTLSDSQVQYIGNDVAATPSDVVLGKTLKGFLPVADTDSLEVVFSALTSLYGFIMASNDTSVGYVTSVRFECTGGVTDDYTDCFPSLAPFAATNGEIVFPRMITIRRIRVIPVTWVTKPTYQLDFMGCRAILGVSRVAHSAYPNTGIFTTKLIAFDNVISSVTTCVQRPVNGLSFQIPVAFQAGRNESLTLSYLAGTEATVNVSFAGFPVAVSHRVTSRNATIYIPSTLIDINGKDGDFPIVATLDNAVSDPLLLEDYIYVEIPVLDLEVTTNQTVEYGTLRNQPVQFFVTASNCSRCLLTTTFHTSHGFVSQSNYFRFLQEDEVFSDIFFSWNLTGQYLVDFTIANNVSNISTIVSVGVENPAKNYYFLASTPNSIPPHSNGTVSMTFGYNGPAVDYPKFPIHPLYEIHLWDGSVLDGVFDTTVPTSGMFHANLTTDHYWCDKHGNYPIYIVIKNNVTIYNFTETHYVDFVEQLSELTLKNANSTHIVTGRPGTVIISIAWGVPWSYRIALSTVDQGWLNETGMIYCDWVDAGNETEIVYDLPVTVPGLYYPVVYARNAVSQLGPIAADTPVKVETPISPWAYSLTVDPRYGQLMPESEGSSLFVTDQMNLTVWYNTSDLMATDMLAVVDYGDGMTLDYGSFVCDESLTHVIQGELVACRIFPVFYRVSGNLVATAQLKNFVSLQTLSTLVPVYYVVPANLVLRLRWRYNSTQSWRNAYGTSENYVPANTEVGLYSNAPAGALFKVCWRFGDGEISDCPTDFQPTPLTTVHVYKKDTVCGTYLEDCGTYAYMNLSGPYDSTEAEKQFYIQYRTVNPMIVDYGPVVKNDILQIEITYDVLATDACVFIDFGSDDVEGPRQILRGSEYMCALYYKIELLRTLRAITVDERNMNKIILQANYTRKGKFYVTASIRNIVDYVDWRTHPNALSKRILVTGGPCTMPIASVQPVPFSFRSQRLEIPASAQHNCTSSFTMTQNWTMEYAISATATEWENLTALHIPEDLRQNFYVEKKGASQMRDLSLYFDKKTLAIGFYRFTLQLDMPEEELLNRTFTFITEIRRTPLVAKFQPPSAYVDGVYGQEQTVDASILSSDPDADGSKGSAGLEIYYYCKRSCEGPWPVFDTFEDVSGFVANPQSWNRRTCDVGGDEDKKTLGVDKPGCFRKGWHSTSYADVGTSFNYPSKDFAPSINAPLFARGLRDKNPNTQQIEDYNVTLFKRTNSNGGVVLNTKYVFENETVNILAVVMDPSTKRFAIAVQSIRIEEGDPPSGSISQLANCGFFYKLGCLMNPTSRTTLRRTLDKWEPGTIYRYNWRFIPVPASNSATNYLEDVGEALVKGANAINALETMSNWTNLTSTGRVGPDLSFSGNTFTANEFGGVYILVAEAWRVGSNGRIARSMMVMYIDNPPNATLATCDIKPNIGTAMVTPFNVKCSGFTDLDDPVLKKFSFVAYTCPTCDPTYLTPIAQVAPELTSIMLPAGDPANNYTLIIRTYCYDSVDAVAFIDNFTIQVAPQTGMDFIQAQFAKLSPIATKSTPDLLVSQLLGFADVLNSHVVKAPYEGNWTLIDSLTTEASDRDKELAKISKSYDTYSKELKTLRNIRLSTLQWIRTVGLSKSSIHSVKSYCTLLSLLQAVPAQAIAYEFQRLILASIKPSVEMLTNYSADITVDPADMDAASSSCVNALGKLSELLEFSAKYVQPENPALTTTTTTEASADGDVASTPAPTQSPQVRQLMAELNEMQEEIMMIVLSRKGVQEQRSVIGGTSSKMSLAADFVGNLNNAALASGGDEDCGSFQLGDATSIFGPSVKASLEKQNIQSNSTEFFKSAKIQLKAKMESGNAHSSVQKSDRSLNSMVQSLTMVDESGSEVVVKNLPYEIEIMVESRNPATPNNLITAAQSYAAARMMKPIKLPVSRDVAVFVNVEQIYDLTSLAVNFSCDTTSDSSCMDAYDNITLQVGPKTMTLSEINATSDEVALFVFINRDGMFPRELDQNGTFGCILPHDRIEDELWDIANGGSVNATTTTTSSPRTTTRSQTTTVSNKKTTLKPGKVAVTTTVPPSQRPASNREQTTSPVGPAKKKCTKHKRLPSNTCFFPNDVMNLTNGSATLYVGVRAIPLRLLRPILLALYREHKEDLSDAMIISKAMQLLLNQSTNALIRYQSYSASCIFWDAAQSDWSTEGCRVGPLTTPGGNPSLTQCFCNHLTTFGSNFDVPMNTFNPNDSAFTKLDQNPICFTFGICVFVLYFTILIWARRKDREDERMWGSLPLMDNDPRNKYSYEVTIWTGKRKGAGTTARVSFILVGDEGETQPRMLDDSDRPILQRGQVDSFVMTVPRSLGKINQLHIWHDNSGKHPAWFFSRMMVFDIQRNQQFFFVCDRWFAVEEDDGMVERSLNVADKSQLASFEHLFVTRTQRKLTDGHMWISVFSRPPRSAFTRTQRLTCCLSVLYCTMLANIMFFGISRDPPGSVRLEFGPIGISAEKIKISVISALIVMPMNLLIVQLFRMSKRKLTRAELKREAIVEQAQKKLEKEQQSANPNDPVASVLGNYGKTGQKKAIRKKDKKKKKQPFKLPWWCTIFAYCLAVATCGVAFWAIVEYGGALGPDKAAEWLAAMVLSLFTDILCLQPLKIVALAMFYALIIKNPTKDEDIEEHMMLKADEEFIRPPVMSSYEKKEMEKHRKELESRRQEYVYLPPDPEELRQARELRLKELAMWRVIKEIASYVIFLYMVMFVAYNNVDPWAWTMQRSTRMLFYDASLSDLTVPPFNTTVDSDALAAGGSGAIGGVVWQDQVWHYLNHTLLPTLFDRSWYNGGDDGVKGTFIKDHVNYLAGIIRLRQLRMAVDSCRVPKKFRRALSFCYGEYSIFDQETHNFTIGWGRVLQANETITNNYNSTVRNFDGQGWFYFNTLKTGSTPSQGQLATYDGGGYVIDLPKSVDEARKILGDLQANRWLDEKTRALFIEFNLFNPSRSLFVVSQNIFEFPSTGGVILNPYFYILKMQSYSTGGEVITLAIQAITLIVVIVLFVRECLKARRLGRQYWKSFWSVLDFCHLIACIIWAGMFAGRYLAFKVLAGRFKKRSQTYTNMDLIVSYDFIVTAFAAAIVSVGTLRFIRLMRFSRNVMLMLATLRFVKNLLISFCVVYFTVFLAFAQAGYLAYQSQLKAYSTFITALETLFAMQLGVYDYPSLRNLFPLFGPIFFVLYSVVVSIVMTNFLVAFITAAYQLAYMDEGLMKEEQKVLSFMIDKLKKLLGITERKPPTLSIDKRFMYMEEAMHEDEIDRFTGRMEELMAKLDAHLEKTKKQYSSMFDEKTLKLTARHVYVTD